MFIDNITLIDVGCVFAIALLIIIRDGFEINQLRREKAELRKKLAESSKNRIDDTFKDVDRRRAVEIESAELEAQLKMANILKDGWRSAAEKGRDAK